MKTTALSVLCLLLVVGAVAGRTEGGGVRPCAMNFENFDFSPLTSSCNPSAMTSESCCRQFDSIFQSDLDELVDNVVCEEEIFSRLEARGYKAVAFDTLCLGGGRREMQTTARSTTPSAPASQPNSAFTTAVPLSLQLALAMGAFIALF
ncbi:hypothetical protein CBR_g16067 [Chara braunii]|uniref:GPI-anchored protein LLG1-like domain-containing protein n=1 Tax=Chara braunii TaxID=69332 RepID=A0A388JT32_CHABU|nr:hypothetical protein CBR_g16067 [Chara braunii]|eukprot:GBG60945.1 hypothetical protein CBR_g16067 [Chara braunii]